MKSPGQEVLANGLKMNFVVWGEYTDNINPDDRQWYGDRWSFWKVPFHLISKLMRKEGLSRVRAPRCCLMMSEIPFFAIGFRVGWLVPLLGLIFVGGSTGQGPDPLRVQVEVGPGPYYVGQGFELRVGVVASGRRPKIDPPRIDGALVWTIGTELKPISRTGIGSIVDAENLFVIRFRVVARRSGTLEVPSIQAQIRNRSGRSRPVRVPIQPVPPLDRPAEFLGGVGRFELRAEATPKVVRVGQELAFRIQVTGPAAWGMTDRPELARYDQLGLGMRIEPEPEETTGEPPARTFVYRLRPTRAGEAVLPPVAIAAFDPAIKRYVTHVTAGVPIRVVAVPAFDPATIDDGESVSGAGRTVWTVWTGWGLSAGLLLGGYALLVMVRRRLRRNRLHGPTTARRYAARLARALESFDRHSSPKPDTVLGAIVVADSPPHPSQDAARRVSAELIHYLQLGMGRPAGALTPDEALQGVARITDCEDLGRQAARLTARCDLALYGDGDAEPGARELLVSARRSSKHSGGSRVRDGELANARPMWDSRGRPSHKRKLGQRIRSRCLTHCQGVRPCCRGVEQLAGHRLDSRSSRRETLDLQRRDHPVDHALDCGERLSLIGANEQVGNAVLAHSSRPADPVDVVLRIVGHVVIDHVADALDINAAPDDIGGHQHRDLPASEPAHHAVANGLGKISMDGGYAGDDSAQPLGEPVGPSLGSSEDDALPGPVALEQEHEQVKLPVGRHRNVVLLNCVERGLVLRQVDLDRLEHVTLGQPANIRVDRGRQQHCLARAGQLAKDPLDIRAESDVQHPISFIQHDMNNIAQIKRSSLDMVEHAAGRADDQVDPA